VKLTFKMKIIGLTVLMAALPVMVMFIMTMKIQGSLLRNAKTELDLLAKMNIDQITQDVYNLCETSNHFLQQRLDHRMNIVHDLSDLAGGIKLGSDMVEWKITNQFSGQTDVVKIPKMYIGGKWFGKTTDFRDEVPVVDKLKKLAGGTCTIFQRLNERGDMLRIATNVPTDEDERAIGTYIPAIHPDGSTDKVVGNLISGQAFRGPAYVVNDWYIATYEPLTNSEGRVIGALYVGEKIGEIEPLKQGIMDITVGKTGYVYILGSSGDTKGKYIVSNDGLRDGENIYNSKDADGNFFIQSIIEKAVKLEKGEVAYEKYPWKNPGETVARNKIAAISYFKPWGWVIGAGMYEDDYYEATKQVEAVKSSLLIRFMLGGALVLAVSITIATYMSNRMTAPLQAIVNIVKKIAEGDVQGANDDLEKVSSRRKKKASLTFMGDFDETNQLIAAVNNMTDNLDSLIGKVQNSGIQVTTSTTEITASVSQLQATVSEQAASTKEVAASSKEISATSEELVKTVDAVGVTLGATVSMAENGRKDLQNMESVMRQLYGATGSISEKLSIVNEKANKISNISTTINKISDQTHLLSLNAAIEAEKAGEFGKGFSVVAREISRLADQTSIATQDIEHMVKDMQSSVSSEVMEMDKFVGDVRGSAEEISSISEQFEKIIDQVRTLDPQFGIVKDGMDAQKEGAQQISDAILQLSESADQTKESLQDFRKVVDQLNETVQALRSEVSKFRIST